MEDSAAAAGASVGAAASSTFSSSVTSSPRATRELMRLAKELGSSRVNPEDKRAVS
jgi:hypothetical protein